MVLFTERAILFCRRHCAHIVDAVCVVGEGGIARLDVDWPTLGMMDTVVAARCGIGYGSINFVN